MNGNWRYALFVTMALLFATGHASAAPTDNPQILHSFCNLQCLDGQQPTYLAPGRGGVFYGIDTGAVFRVDPASRNFSVFYKLDPGGWYTPRWLASASNGNLYGALEFGDVNSGPIIFRLSPTGDYTLLHTFASDEYAEDVPNSAPVEDSQGNWYGTTQTEFNDPLVRRAGAAPGMIDTNQFYGDSIYEITRDGVYKTLDNSPDVNGVNGLVLAPDGNLYGTTEWGGSYGVGSVFRFTSDGVLTTLHSFGAPGAEDEGASPTTPLVVGPDGALYGATSEQASGGYPPEDGGAMFRITLSGQLTTLHHFDEWPGTSAALTLMPDGYFYGIRATSLFRISPTGDGYTEFPVDNGGNFFLLPAAPLLRGFDNALYGIMDYSGRWGGGTLFRFVPPPVQ